jgi:asparagine N-glycosylation enzyme membrane subunit Stt3
MKLDKYYGNDGPAESAAEEHHHHEAKHSGGANPVSKIKFEALVENRYILIGIAVIIIALNIIVRAGLLQYQGLFEPDGFFYYSVIRQAIANHFVVSNYLNISGFPSHNFIGEAPGLIYLTVIAYYLLNGMTGLSALTVMRWMPILFGVLYAILAYYLAKMISKSKTLGLITMFLVSISSGNIARTAGAVYRGDSFITLFVMLALLFMLKCFEEKKHSLKWVWGVLGAITLGSGIVIWTGSPFIIVIYMFALLLAVVYGFIKADKAVLLSALVVSVTLFLMHILQLLYISAGVARAVQFSGSDFYIFYLPILIGSIIAYYAIANIHKIKVVATARNRVLVALAAGIIAAIVIFALFGSTIMSIASPIRGTPAAVNTTNSTSANMAARGTSITSTTQELQPPSFAFLWSSFNIQAYLAIIGLAFATTVLFYKHFGREHLVTFLAACAIIIVGLGLLAFLGGPLLGLAILGVILIAAFGLFILFGSKLIAKRELKIGIMEFLVVLAYFAVTVYLQLQAIRFNAIISVPLAIFAAFGLYGVGRMFYEMVSERKAVSSIIVAAMAIAAIVMVYSLAVGGYFSGGLLALRICAAMISIVLVALLLYGVYALATGRPVRIKYIVVAVILILLAYAFYNTYIESYTAIQADGINTSFLSAVSWMKSNTPANATVLALWPDGSVVEGWANRTSYMDSVGGENGTRIYPYSRFLFNTTRNSSYLYQIGKPQYLIARTFWYEELGGIAQEGLVSNATQYGFVIMQVINVSRNSTTQFFSFQSGSMPYYKSELLIRQANGTNSFSAYLGLANSTRFVEMRSVILYNTSNGAYSILNTSKNITTANYTLMVGYSGNAVNGAYILGPKLAESNLFDFTFLCNTVTCAYDNSNVTLTDVYSNSDTRIFKINYLR